MRWGDPDVQWRVDRKKLSELADSYRRLSTMHDTVKKELIELANELSIQRGYSIRTLTEWSGLPYNFLQRHIGNYKKRIDNATD